jgi:hypothetical protein
MPPRRVVIHEFTLSSLHGRFRDKKVVPHQAELCSTQSPLAAESWNVTSISSSDEYVALALSVGFRFFAYD